MVHRKENTLKWAAIIKDFISPLELGDMFEFDDLLKLAGISDKTSSEYGVFNKVFYESDEYKQITKVRRGFTRNLAGSPILTKYMKTK